MDKELKGVLLVGAANAGLLGSVVLGTTIVGAPLAVALGVASCKWAARGIRLLRGREEFPEGRTSRRERRRLEQLGRAEQWTPPDYGPPPTPEQPEPWVPPWMQTRDEPARPEPQVEPWRPAWAEAPIPVEDPQPTEGTMRREPWDTI